MTSIVTYLTLFNLGLNTAAAKYTAEYVAKDRREDLEILLSTIVTAIIVLCALIVVVGVVISPFIPRIFNLSPNLYASGRVAFIITAFNVSIMLIWGIFGNTLYGMQRVDLWMLLRTCHLLGCAGLVAIFLNLEMGLVDVIVAMTSR